MAQISRNEFIEAYNDMLENREDGINLGFTDEKVIIYPARVTPAEPIMVELAKEDIYDVYATVYEKVDPSMVLDDLIEDLVLYEEEVPEIEVTE